jgi:hypothetical protein
MKEIIEDVESLPVKERVIVIDSLLGTITQRQLMWRLSG